MHFPAQVQPVVHESQEKHMHHGAILGACSSHEFDSSLGDLIVSRPEGTLPSQNLFYPGDPKALFLTSVSECMGMGLLVCLWLPLETESRQQD